MPDLHHKRDYSNTENMIQSLIQKQYDEYLADNIPKFTKFIWHTSVERAFFDKQVRIPLYYRDQMTENNRLR